MPGRGCLGPGGLLRLCSALAGKAQGPFKDAFQAEEKSMVFAIAAVFSGVPLG